MVVDLGKLSFGRKDGRMLCIFVMVRGRIFLLGLIGYNYKDIFIEIFIEMFLIVKDRKRFKFLMVENWFNKLW